MWDPTTYLRYADERARPFADLVARIDRDEPREVVDLGCGPGTLTVQLAQRWPTARIAGLDSSPDMIDRARSLLSTVEFTMGDVHDWNPSPDTDVVVCNAVLQWVPDHRALLRRWIAGLPAQAVFAFQVPGNFDSPSHTSIAEVARLPRFQAALNDVLRPNPVDDPADYATDLFDLGCAVDAWETTYLHVLPATGDVHPVLTWVRGTALRPVQASLDPEEFAAFTDELTVRLRQHYPVHNGQTYLPFRRIFVVATTP